LAGAVKQVEGAKRVLVGRRQDEHASGSIAANTHRLVGDGPPKNESADEETRVDHCTALGDVASRSASRYRTTTGTSTGTTTGTLNGTTTRTLNGTTTSTSTGVICVEEMVATFCNVPTARTRVAMDRAARPGRVLRPDRAARPGRGPRPDRSGGAGSNTSSIPTCPDFPPANELCN